MKFDNCACKDLLVKNLKRKKRALEREAKIEEAEAYDFSPSKFLDHRT